MKKMTAVFTAMMLVGMMLTGCSGKEKPQETSAAAADKVESQAVGVQEYEKTLIILGNAAPASETNHMYQYCEKFKTLVEEKTGGNVVIEIHPNGELGGERDLVEGVQLGTVDMCFIASAPLGNFVKETLVFDFPFLFRDFEHVEGVMGGEIGDRIATNIEEQTGTKFLSWGVNGFRQFCNNKGPVKSPADIKGMKVRTMENKIHMETFSALGTDPTPMGAGELYTALQQGTVDGMEGPLSWILPSKYNEVQKYMSLTGHFYAPSVAIMNKARFDGLPENVKAVMEECAKEAEIYQLQFCKEIDEKLAKEAAAVGMEVLAEDELEMDAFREAVKSVYDAHPEFDLLIQEIKNVK